MKNKLTVDQKRDKYDGIWISVIMTFLFGGMFVGFLGSIQFINRPNPNTYDPDPTIFVVGLVIFLIGIILGIVYDNTSWRREEINRYYGRKP